MTLGVDSALRARRQMTSDATPSAGTTTKYKPGDVVVYPAHGLGEIQGIEVGLG